MTRLLVTCTFLAASAWATAREPASRPADPDRLTIMTFNIRLGIAPDGENDWRHRADMVSAVLADHQPDLVGLQEAYAFQIEAILRARPEYAYVGVGRDDGKTKGEHAAILYRRDQLKVLDHGTFWLSQTPEVPGSKSWKTACTRVCTWVRFSDPAGTRPFYHYNTHLDHVSQEAREKGVELIHRRMRDRDPADPVVLTGDFNADEDNPCIAFIKGTPLPPVRQASGTRPEGGATHPNSNDPLRLVDSFRTLHPQATQTGTAGGWQGARGGAKIDYVFVPSSTRVLRAEIIHDSRQGRYPSDHFPVLAVIERATLLPARGLP